MRKSYLDCILAEPEEGCFLIKDISKRFLSYLLPRSCKIFMNVFAFLYVNANSKEIYEETFLPSESFRKMLHFCLRSKANNIVATPIFLCGFQ